MKKLFWTGLILFVCHALQAQKEYKAYVVSNAHFDSQWNWDVQTSIDQFVYNTLVRNLWLLERYPNYVFNFEGGVKYQWMKEYYPLEYERIKKYIAEGRWHISGSTWDATDPNIPSPESFFRNILYGQKFYKKEFGITSRDIFLPDCFGFGYTLPTIASHAGLIGFSTQKLQWRSKPFYGDSKVPFTIGLWQGVDGSRIMAAADARDYNFRWKEEDISYNQELIDLAKSSPTKTVYRYYGIGDTGGSPSIGSVVSVEKGLKGDGPVQIISATSDQLFRDYLPFDQHPELPVYDGELLMDVHATGCYTSQAAMKRFNRRNEQLGDAAERAAVIADYLGGMAYPSETLEDSWKRFIWHQFHDDLTGTSIPRAYTFSWNDELIAQTRFAGVIQAATGAVASALDTKVKGIPVIVYNPLSSVRREVVEMEVPMPKEPATVTVFAPDGKSVPSQKLSYAKGQLRLLFLADAAPVSFSVYEVRTGGKAIVNPVLKAEDRLLENEIYKVTLNAQGDIVSLWDKRVDRELVGEGKAFRLAYFGKNESFHWPAWEIQKETIDAEPSVIGEDVKCEVVEQGPVRVTLKVERKRDSSCFIQYIRLTAGSDRLDVLNEVDWAATNALLKVEFPCSFGNPKATYDLGIGTVRRENNTPTAYEVYAQQWADLTDPEGAYGLAVLNDCKYGWDKPDDHTLRLTLLHTPKTEKHYAYQDRQDWGHHTFTYSVIGHTGTPLQAGISWKAEALNHPLLAFTASRHKGNLGKTYSFVQTDTPQVAVKALKKSEDGKYYVVRLYELEGRNADRVEVTFPATIERAVEMSGAEEVIGTARTEGNKLIFSTTAYKPKTFGVWLKKPEVSIQPSRTETLLLKYTHRAFTPDAFRYTGNFDEHGNSYAAELIGEELISDGIPFRIAPVDENHVIKCKKNVIGLPQHAAYSRLYILAAATDKDRETVFRIDGKEYRVKVPYYSGFYGQWGHTGHTEGYIKDVPVAYVGSHRHGRKANDAYIFTYMFRIALDLPAGAKELELPDDDHIAVFAVTVSDGRTDRICPAMEMRALPFQTTKE